MFHVEGGKDEEEGWGNEGVLAGGDCVQGKGEGQEPTGRGGAGKGQNERRMGRARGRRCCMRSGWER